MTARILFFVLSLLFVVMPALAQQPQQKSYTFTFTVDQINVVRAGLLELKGKEMLDTYAALMSQIQAQNNAPTPPDPEPKKE